MVPACEDWKGWRTIQLLAFPLHSSLYPLPRPAHLLQRLRDSCPLILSLDGGRIQANGIVSGASFVVQPVEKAEYRFGSSGLLGEVICACSLGGGGTAPARLLPKVDQ